MSAPVLIRAEDLSKRYAIGALQQNTQKTLREALSSAWSGYFRGPSARGSQRSSKSAEIWALKGLSFEISQGDVVGIVGRNGAGKSTLLKILSRITEPTSGRAVIRGRAASLLEVGTGFHGDLTGRENTFLNGAILGMRRGEILRKFDEIVAFAEIEKFIDTPVKHYSSGMYMRLAFAIAAHLEPDILIVDEVLAVGDIAFQKKCLGRMHDIAGQGRTVLFVSHNIPAVRQLCSRGLYLKEGRIAGIGTADDIVRLYLGDMPKAGSLAGLQEQIAALPPDPVFRLESIALLQDGEPCDEIDSGKPVEITVVYSVSKPTDGLHIVVELRDLDETLIFETLHNGNDERMPAVGQGRYRSTLVLPPDLLAPMAYEVRIFAAIHNDRKCLLDPVVFGFQVQPTGGVNRAYPGYLTAGKLAPMLEWITNVEPSGSQVAGSEMMGSELDR